MAMPPLFPEAAAERLPLGVKLKKARTDRGLTQEELAQHLGVSKITVLRWENGSARPSQLAAGRLQEVIGLSYDLHDTNINSIPRLNQGSEDQVSRKISARGLLEESEMSIEIDGNRETLKPTYFVVNGPKDQTKFHEKLINMQINPLDRTKDWSVYARRLSLIAWTSLSDGETAQFKLENPKTTSVSWNSNYGTHGWHRYVGRFPPHLIRALLNYLGADSHSKVLDPFSGSGTTLVECRLLGIPAIGIEVCPLSSLISKTKSKFPVSSDEIRIMITRFEIFYSTEWSKFINENNGEVPDYSTIFNRSGNTLKPFSNHEKWMTREALLGCSIALQFAGQLEGYTRDLLLIALSAKMRSIGNIDVDVVRAEYSQQPRHNVNVGQLIKSQLQKMSKSIDLSVKSHSSLISSSGSIEVRLESILTTDIADESITHVITSPPYGVEAISYLRTHLLSYRILETYLGEDPYKFGAQVIGSEYLPKDEPKINSLKLEQASNIYNEYFSSLMENLEEKKLRMRALMMMKFFEEMHEVILKLARWVVDDGKVAFIVGNKAVGKSIVPTDKIIIELFENDGFEHIETIAHKLKTNNSNSQVPWQENIIQNEFILLFQRNKRKI